jgi:hypothetical protein
MLWQRSAPLQLPHDSRSVPGSEVLRESALQASWRRDRQVAQRRILWRWAVFYAQRWAPGGVAVLLLAVGTAYMTGWRPLGKPTEPVDVGDATARWSTPSPAPPPAIEGPDQTPGANAAVPSPVNDATALSLRASPMLQPKRLLTAPTAETPASPDTLTLQSEKWLHSKEP